MSRDGEFLGGNGVRGMDWRRWRFRFPGRRLSRGRCRGNFPGRSVGWAPRVDEVQPAWAESASMTAVPEPRKAGEVRVGSCDERRLLSAYHTISVLCHSALDLRICAHCVRGLSTSETMRCGLNQFRRTSAASIFYASALPPIGISIRCARVGGGKRYVSWRPYPFRKARSENQRDDRSKK